MRKIRIPVFSIDLNEKLDDTIYRVLEDKAIPTKTFKFLGDYTKYGEFMDERDGYDPAVIRREIFDRAEEIRMRRAKALG